MHSLLSKCRVTKKFWIIALNNIIYRSITILLKVHVIFSYSLSSWIFNLSTDAIDFHAPVKLGHVIHLAGRATFTSSRSMEIEVVVDSKDYVSGSSLVSIGLQWPPPPPKKKEKKINNIKCKIKTKKKKQKKDQLATITSRQTKYWR